MSGITCIKDAGLTAGEVARAYENADPDTRRSVKKLLDLDANGGARSSSLDKVSVPSARGTDLNKVCKDYGIRVYSYEHLRKKNDGWLRDHEDIDSILQNSGGIAFTIEGGQPVIVYDNDRGDSEIHYIVAHELGHILLGHLGLRSDFKKGMPDFAEVEANIFAAVLTANDVLCRYGREAAI